MQDETSESKTFDVQYSIRLPEDLATEINARAAAEGVKPSTWIRNCITSAIRQKNEVNADMLRTPLLMLLKQDKSIRALIRDITNEKLPEEIQLRKKCENLTTSMSGIMERMKETKHDLDRLYREREIHNDKIKSLTNEIGVLKQMSHGDGNNTITKGMIERYLKELEILNAERRQIADSISGHEMSLSEAEVLLIRMKEENLKAMVRLKQLGVTGTYTDRIPSGNSNRDV